MRARRVLVVALALALPACKHKDARPIPPTAASELGVPDSSMSAEAETETETEPMPPEHLTHAQAVSDARWLLDAIEQTHPDPYTSIGGKVEYHRRKHALLEALPAEGIATAELGRRLSDFVGALGDGHTFLSSDSVRWNEPDSFLPLVLFATRDGLYLVGHDHSALKGKLGHRLGAVAGVGVQTVAERLGRALPAENVMGINGRMVNIVRSPAMLSRLLPELEGAATLELSFVSPRGRTSAVTIPFEGSDKPRDQWREPPREGSGLPPAREPYEFRRLADGKVGYLRIGDMMGREGFESMHRQGWGDARAALTRWHEQRDREMPEDIERALAKVPSILETVVAGLEAMKQERIEALIVDLRGNTGGVTSTFVAVAHLIHGDAVWGVPFAERFATVVSPLLLAKYQTTLEQYGERNDAPDLELGDYVFGAAPPDPATARREGVEAWKQNGMSFADTIERLGPDPLYTPPRIVVLCDATTYSAGFHAMYFLDQLGATVVGVPSMQSPNAFMEYTSFVLPISRLEGGISNSIQLLELDDPSATIYAIDHEIDGETLARYDFDTQTALLWALDLLDTGASRTKRRRGR